jgi:hypothetical protein
MMADLLIGAGCLGAGLTALVCMPYISRRIAEKPITKADRVRIKLRNMSGLELRVDYQCTCAAAMVCAGKNDRRGVQHARKRAQLILEEAQNRAERKDWNVLH